MSHETTRRNHKMLTSYLMLNFCGAWASILCLLDMWASRKGPVYPEYYPACERRRSTR